MVRALDALPARRPAAIALELTSYIGASAFLAVRADKRCSLRQKLHATRIFFCLTLGTPGRPDGEVSLTDCPRRHAALVDSPVAKLYWLVPGMYCAKLGGEFAPAAVPIADPGAAGAVGVDAGMLVGVPNGNDATGCRGCCGDRCAGVDSSGLSRLAGAASLFHRP